MFRLLLCWIGFYQTVKIMFIWVFIGHWYLSLFCQTFFLHRYMSHRMFELSPFWRQFFVILTGVAQGPSYLNLEAYARMHRQHHQHSDQELDPHSPVKKSNPFSFMLNTLKQFRKEVALSDVRLSGWEQFSEAWLTRLLWILAYTGIYIIWAPSLYYFFLLPLHFVMGPIHGFIVNWYGHKRGYRNFDLDDHSQNTLPIDLLAIGELYQNNHHHDAKRLNFAYRWFEVDLTYLMIRVFSFLGIVRLKSS